MLHACLAQDHFHNISQLSLLQCFRITLKGVISNRTLHILIIPTLGAKGAVTQKHYFYTVITKTLGWLVSLRI